MASNLAPVFVDGERVALQGNPRPDVASILAAIGRHPKHVFVVHLRHRTDPQGRSLAPTDRVDRRALASSPIYLRCFGVPWARSPSP